MTMHHLSAIKLHQIFYACLCAALLYSSFGAVSESRAQTILATDTDILCPALDMSDEDCALITSVLSGGDFSNTGSTGVLGDPPPLPPLSQGGDRPRIVNAIWRVAPSVANRGRNSLQSGPIRTPRGQASCLVLTVTLPANTVIRFTLRTNSRGSLDRLIFLANDQVLIENFSADLGSTIRDWELQETSTSSTVNRLIWCYATDSGSGSAESDAGWLDTLSFIPVETVPFCEALDLPPAHCALIRAITYDPPSELWELSATDALRGTSALASPALDDGDNACLIVELDSALPPDSNLVFAWRLTSQSAMDTLQFNSAGTQQRQISSMPEWQTEYIEPDSFDSTLRWCYSKNSAAVSQQNPEAWLDSLFLVTPADRHQIEIRVIGTPSLVPDTNTFRYIVQVQSEATLLPQPDDWVLTVSGIENIAGAATSHDLDFTNGSVTINNVMSTPANPLLPSSVLLALAELPSLAGATGTSISITLPSVELSTLEVQVSTAVTQTEPDEGIEIVVMVKATDNFNRPFEPTGLVLNVSPVENATPMQSSYVLSFAEGQAQTTVTVSLTTRGEVGRIEISAGNDDTRSSSASITINPAPRRLASVAVAVPDRGVVVVASVSQSQSVAVTVTVNALDNYGDPEPVSSDISLTATISDGATISPETVTFSIGTTGTRHLAFEIMLQADRTADTIVSIELMRGSLPDSVLLLPLGGAQITVVSHPPAIVAFCEVMDSRGSDCAQIRSLSYDPPASEWIVTDRFKILGDNSIQSPDIDHSERTCLVLELSLPANAVISVAGRTSSEGQNDQLEIIANDDLRLDTISAEGQFLQFGAVRATVKSWEQRSYFLPVAITTLSWCYAKNAQTDLGEDRAWIDNLSFDTSNISYQSRICSALDVSSAQCAMIRSVSYDPPPLLWLVTPLVSLLDDTSLRSADVSDNRRACLVLELSLPANAVISVGERIFSESLNDRLEVTARLEGSADEIQLGTRIRKFPTFSPTDFAPLRWDLETYYLPTAIDQLAFCYRKNAANSYSDDAAWIDGLNFSASQISYKDRICTALDMTDNICSIVQSVEFDPPGRLWVVSSATAVAGGTSIHSPRNLLSSGQSSCLVLNLSTSLPANTRISYSRNLTANVAGSRNATLDVYAGDQMLEQYSVAGRGWQRTGRTASDSFNRLRWCFVKRTRFLNTFNDVSIDRVDLAPATDDIVNVCGALDIEFLDCFGIQSVSYDPPGSPWIADQSIFVTGTSSLRSADIGDGETSCLILVLNQPSPPGSLVRFALRIEAQPETDFLYFAAGDQRLEENFSVESGETLRDWQSREFFLPPDTSSLSWCYSKDDSTSVAPDSAWVDSLTFVSAKTVFCDVLDLPADRCALIQSVTYDRAWTVTSSPDSFRGARALTAPPLDDDQSACATIVFENDPTPVIGLAFSWRITAPSDPGVLLAQAGAQERQISSGGQWQTEYIELNSLETTQVSWCYGQDSAASGEDPRAWLDSLLLVTTQTDHYRTAIAVTGTPILISTNEFQFQVSVTAASLILPPPLDWALIVSGVDNVTVTDSTYPLVFDDDLAQVDVLATAGNPLLPSNFRLALADRASFLGATTASISFSLTISGLGMLQILVSTAVTQTAVGDPIEIAIEVRASDSFDSPVDPPGLTLEVSAVGVDVPQNSYDLSFTGGTAPIMFTVELASAGVAGSIELSVTSGDINAEASVLVNPTPPVLESITLSAVSSNLVQTTANTTVSAELVVTALDNYGNPFEAGAIGLEFAASNDAIISNDAMVISTLTVNIGISGIAQQTVEILPQNNRDTTVTVQLSHGDFDESVQLLPDSGIQIIARALRVLSQLQLSLVNRVSPLQQLDARFPITAQVQLIGLDQSGQPVAFSAVMLTATADPSDTQVTLDPEQLAATGPEGAVTDLEVTFSGSPEPTMITITITNPGTDATANDLVVEALPDSRDPIEPLKIVSEGETVTELDLVVALRWLADQESDNAALAANLEISDTAIMDDGIENLRTLFTETDQLDRIDFHRDGRADQLDLRVLMRYMSGLRGAQLEEDISTGQTNIIRLLLGLQ